ncbi:cyclic pyranopterin monophosphate synthase subunit MoaC [Desulfocapsa sulfexigens DSM 10523]|uniref:Cyclic pyranopterin monophosphate synthase n=1 Tax=Desulfocapsa sulfexigens (strain DSM 10523 / SB164P1) TaxID=1167006 RepID=M1PB28_DESSD|nr:cyclic pyranopterin monophosphate synthase MoaC [Desulfocapsa sulfexigens]AGF78852.1 cyclic pyranopterin monophosphate synthase subunit MoaC [Desulfocapsa sulfexigens DSM 10523]
MKENQGQELTHFDADGNAIMVDVSRKLDTERVATASGKITLSQDAYDRVKSGSMAKGDVLGVARVAGIMAAKKVDSLIPLCHPLAVTKITIDFVYHDDLRQIEIVAVVGITGKTGVEMEALTAVSITALTIYDMCKAIDKAMVISDICLEKKTGGKSGTFIRPE